MTLNIVLIGSRVEEMLLESGHSCPSISAWPLGDSVLRNPMSCRMLSSVAGIGLSW